MGILSKASLLETMKLKTEVIELSETESIIVSEIGAGDYIKLWSECTEETGEKDKDGKAVTKINMERFTPALLAYSIINEDGSRMFSDEEIPVLARCAQGPFLKIAEAAKKLNGLNGDEGKPSEPITVGSTDGELPLL